MVMHISTTGTYSPGNPRPQAPRHSVVQLDVYWTGTEALITSSCLFLTPEMQVGMKKPAGFPGGISSWSLIRSLLNPVLPNTLPYLPRWCPNRGAKLGRELGPVCTLGKMCKAPSGGLHPARGAEHAGQCVEKAPGYKDKGQVQQERNGGVVQAHHWRSSSCGSDKAGKR